jgi:serine phosphatase RsbU (regulator of sigma subunit)
VVGECADWEAEDIANALRDAVFAHCADSRTDDDLTVIVLRAIGV